MQKLGELNKRKQFLKKIRCTDKVGQDVSWDSRVWGEGEKSEQNPQPGSGCRVRPSPVSGGSDPEGLWGGGHSEHLRSPRHVQGSCPLG